MVYVNGPGDYDDAADRLIEVSTLAQLDAIRYDLDGNGIPAGNDNGAHAAAFPDAAPGMGCAPCAGYELANNLDFDTNGDGQVDAGDDYWNAGDGWTPIGHGVASYDAELHGNRLTISGLHINRRGANRLADANYMGLFGGLTANGTVHHLGLHGANVSGNNWVGALAGVNRGSIYAVYTSGRVSAYESAGGLVGENTGTISAVWSDAEVSAELHAGGIAGFQQDAVTLTASYFRGQVRADWGRNPTYATYENGLDSNGLTFGGAVGGAPLRGTISNVYYSSEHTSQKRGGEAKAAGELQAPTGYADIYANWNVDADGDGNADNPWDFGSAGRWPSLRGVDEPPVSRPDVPADSTFDYISGNGLYKPNTRATLLGDGNYDPEGRPVSYFWEQTDDNTVSLSNARTANPTFTTPPLGEAERLELYFRLTVTAGGLSHTAVTGIWVTEDEPTESPEVNIPPQAVISDLGRWVRYLDDDTRTEVECTENQRINGVRPSGSPLCHYEEPGPVTEGALVRLDGRESNDDLDGGSIGYLWEQVGGTSGTLANTTSSRATFTTPTGLTSDDAYTIRLTVTDDDGLTDTDEITIQVTAKPTADAGDLVVLGAGERFTLRGAGAGYPGETLIYDWSETDSPTQTAFDAPIAAARLSVRNLPLTAPDVTTDTSYTWTLTVTDSDGLSELDEVTVRVRLPRTAAQQTPPNVDAGPDQVVVKGDDVELSGQASHPANERLTGPEWTQTGGPEIVLYNTRSFNPPFTVPEVVNPVRLTFRLTVCIYDPFALESEEICSTDDVVVRVLRQPSQPTVNAGEDQAAVQDEEVRLDGLAVQPQGEAVTYEWEWTQIAGTTALLDNAAIPNPTFTVPPVAATETLTFRLTVCVAGRLDLEGEAICAYDDVDVKALPAAVGSSGAGGDGGGGPVISELTPCVLDLGIIPGGTVLGGTECDYSIERNVRYFRFTLSEAATVLINLQPEDLSATVSLPAGSYTVEVITERTISANGQPQGPFRMYISVATN